MSVAWYVDLSGRGIGNIVLILSALLARGVPGLPVVVYCDRPTDLAGLHTEGLFEVVTERPAGPSMDVSQLCNLATLRHPRVVHMMRAIVIPDTRTDLDADAGFSIRTSDPTHDGGALFMNEVAAEAMKHAMTRYRRPIVCSNDKHTLTGLPPHARVVEDTDPTVRNASSHWAQWHALAKCPVVYHGVSSDDGSISSTFAPTAAVYGGKQLVGVDNKGHFFAGATYHW